MFTLKFMFVPSYVAYKSFMKFEASPRWSGNIYLFVGLLLFCGANAKLELKEVYNVSVYLII